ncbi:MAG: hypothetical protein OXL38_11960 [Gammaproteobacteria bacterium]|nr:hypothetical protein [Gammaproteobacteria bacterium]
MRRLTKLAVLVAVAAVAADTFGDVTGFTTFTCSDEIAYRYDSVADACADHGIRAYMDWDEGIFPECRICDDDGGGNSPGPPPGEIIIIPPICPEGKHLHGGVCHADHVCGDGEIGGGGEDCEPCGEGSVPNNSKTACEACAWDQIPDAASAACVTRPFDVDANALAARVRNCGAATVGSHLAHSLVSVGYGVPTQGAHHYGETECQPKGNKPPTSVAVRLHRAALETSGDAESSVWHWAPLAAIHEFIHAGDFIGYDSCAPWYTSGGVRDIKRAGYTESDINENGFEKWTVERADQEYEATFGVLSPYDPFHNATADNKPLPCLFY